jgi:thiamine kinase-like enzyme
VSAPGVERWLGAVLDQSPYFAGEPRRLEPIEGGLSSVSFKVTTSRGAAFVRLPHPGDEMFGINRQAEHQNTRLAAAWGAAPAVLDHLPERHALVVEWVEGRTLAPADLADEKLLTRLAAACRSLHAGHRFVGDFDIFAVQRRYLGIVQEHGFRLPDGYLDLLPEVDLIARSLAVWRVPTVACHNDLVPANIVDDGTRLWLVDYEYAGNNDPCFELGNIWNEAELTIEHLTHLVDAYHGGHMRHRVARARLLGLMARYCWALWASIQSAVSPAEFDFWTWGIRKYELAQADFRGPEFADLLADATRSD